ncbi:MAG TPA: RecQ family ATP-dependent DNA helicase [Lacipirellulaceae bacterium]
MTIERPAVKLPPEARRLLKSVFGFDNFRRGQEEVVARLLAGRSALAIFPTGSGKSLCYQLPALLLDGLTVVVSPLIALMKDQIDFLVERQVPAARLDSSLDRDAAMKVYDDLRAGRTRLLFASPERLGNERFLQLLGRQSISLLAVDEAHCISEWGHNFRPDYLKIAALAKQLKVGRVLALTATATPEVAADIAAAFEIDSDDVVQTGFYRPNLELRVTGCADRERCGLLVQQLRSRPIGPTIVYVTLQKTAAQVAMYLSKAGFSARAYHAGLPSEERTEIQDAFMAADDMIVVATIAFGMGIDKANIRGVYHFNLPKSLESYMQEIGRAGRDGEPAVCEMLACADDVVTLENFSYGDTPEPETVAAIVDELLAEGEQFDVSVYDLAQRHDARELVVKTLLTYLELDGVLHATGPFYSEFRYQTLRGDAEILVKFDPARAQFLKSLFQASRRGKKWYSLDANEVSQKLGQPRERIIAALNYLEEQGDLIVEATGVRQGYRRSQQPADRASLVKSLAERFLQRDAHDIARVRSVVALAQHEGCLTRHLLNYFGEDRGECGHCGGCDGATGNTLARPERWSPRPDDVAIVRRLRAESHEALQSPRQLARFLCGISSPATTRAKLRSRPEFGQWSHVPFADVLALAQRK